MANRDDVEEGSPGDVRRASRAAKPNGSAAPGGLWDLLRAVLHPAFPGGALERLVFLAFVRHANRQGDCWPSFQTIARETGLKVAQGRGSANGVKNVVYRLRGAGLLSWSEKPGRTNLYHVDHAALDARIADYEAAATAGGAGAPTDGVTPHHGIGGPTPDAIDNPTTAWGTPPHRMGGAPHGVGDTPTPGGDEVAQEETQEETHEATQEKSAGEAAPPAPPALTALTFDDVGAPLVTWAASEAPPTGPGGLVWIPLRPAGMYVGLNEGRLAELQGAYPLVDVLREFSRPEGIRDWNAGASATDRKSPGKRGFWRHVHRWLEREQKRAEQARRRVFASSAKAGTQAVPGTVCGCGGPKAEGAALCSSCAERFAAYTLDSMSRERRPQGVLP